MADTGIFATTAEILRKAGDNASTDASAEAYTNDFIAQIESRINVLARFNFSDAYTTVNADFKALLKEAATNFAAIYILNYKPLGQDGLMSRIEYEDRVNVLRDAGLNAISLLRDKKHPDFLNAVA